MAVAVLQQLQSSFLRMGSLLGSNSLIACTVEFYFGWSQGRVRGRTGQRRHLFRCRENVFYRLVVMHLAPAVAKFSQIGERLPLRCELIPTSLRRVPAPEFPAGGIALFIPWRVGAEESGAASPGRRWWPPLVGEPDPPAPCFSSGPSRAAAAEQWGLRRRHPRSTKRLA